MLEVAQAFSVVVSTGGALDEAQRTFDMYKQQPPAMIDYTMYYVLEREVRTARANYTAAIENLSWKMNVSYGVAAGSALGCGTAFILPTP